MKKNIIRVSLAAMLMTAAIGCSSDDDNSSKTVTQEEVVVNYADVVFKNYTDSHTKAKELRVALEAFTANPSEATLETAKQAWLDSRVPYGQTEAFRFAEGPIDDEDGPEGLLNAWPLDEEYIDNIIATTDDLSKSYLEGLNEVGGEANISIGYHAIEYLLWGKDDTAPSMKIPGQRAYTDFVGDGATETRRRAYLNICAELIVDHLQLMLDEWKDGGAYRTTFIAMDKDKAIDNVIASIAELSKSELAGERMQVALTNHDQEDEHSCFSDNTHNDIILNYQGIKNVFYGNYEGINGGSLYDLLNQKNPTLASEIQTLISETDTAVEAISNPFDYAISSEAPTENAKVQAAIDKLKALGDQFTAAQAAYKL
ncbi:imelysin family protein [Aureivirga sp. CE67]|uniref:imelysin family protein n=1 Tax=Aureivirga sp. CE67 TaxID=1788983 RepID=UPI0018C99A1A|nr:imelysin family protein [Aureivirga sp. CE67]